MESVAHSHRNLHSLTMMTNTSTKTLQTESDDDNEETPHFIFEGKDDFVRFLVITPKKEKAVTFFPSLVVQKHIEITIATPKSVKKLKKKLLVAICRKSRN